MNCQEAIERLPWWLNGSLEPAERREVEEHLAACAACREALGETRLAWEIFAQHVPSEALVAYAYDERPAGIDPTLIERHLTSCPQCAAELEMARASRLLGEHEDVAVLAPRPTRQAVPERRPRRERGWQAAALAASLTGLIAIGGWVQSVQQMHRPTYRGGQEIARESHPGAQVNTPVAQLFQGETRGTERHLVKLPKEGMATIVLTLSDTYQRHAYDIRDAHDRPLLRDVDLPAGLKGVYFVTFDPALLPPGDYVIQVYGTDNGAHVPSTPIPFTIE